MTAPFTIGVLTAGGDCPGLNACIRAVVRRTVGAGGRVIGIPRGFLGLLNGETVVLDTRSVGSVIHLGGTMLRTARCQEMRDEAGMERAVRQLDSLQLNGLVVIGGNGGLRGGWELSHRARTPVIGVPKTIDNDIGGTDYSIGFDSAVNTAMQAIDKIRDTARSHERAFLVEVMGRDTGHLAVSIGLAAGAELTLVPEIPTSPEEVVQALARSAAMGKLSCIGVVAEGWHPGAQGLAEYLKACGREVRVAVLGHQQRGGPPTAFDRILASQFGARAVELLAEGKRSMMVGMQHHAIISTSLQDAWSKVPPLRKDLFQLSRQLAGIWPQSYE